MCCIVAKDRNKQGCYALKSRIGKHLAEYTESLEKSIKKEGSQIIIISRPTAYGEYTPIDLLIQRKNSVKEFFQCE